MSSNWQSRFIVCILKKHEAILLNLFNLLSLIKTVYSVHIPRTKIISANKQCLRQRSQTEVFVSFFIFSWCYQKVYNEVNTDTVKNYYAK